MFLDVIQKDPIQADQSHNNEKGKLYFGLKQNLKIIFLGIVFL